MRKMKLIIRLKMRVTQTMKKKLYKKTIQVMRVFKTIKMKNHKM